MSHKHRKKHGKKKSGGKAAILKIAALPESAAETGSPLPAEPKGFPKRALVPTFAFVSGAAFAAAVIAVVLATMGTSLFTPGAATPPPDTVPAKTPLTLFLSGDILLTRSVGNVVRREGPEFLFRDLAEVISRCDIAFANLESPVGFKGSPYPGKDENITFRGDPAYLFSLRNAGFDVVSLANNHMNDFGSACVGETLEYLDAAGIARCGAGMNGTEALAPAVVERNGRKVAFLAFADPLWSVIQAGESNAGVALAREDIVVKAIKDTRMAVNPDILVVSFHWGDEFSTIPHDGQKSLGHAAIMAGADIVAGHHPHVLQGIERFGTGIIFYSLGNFSFDMQSPKTYDTMYAKVDLPGSGGVGTVTVSAARIEPKAYTPRQVSGDQADPVLTFVRSASGKLGTYGTRTGDALVF